VAIIVLMAQAPQVVAVAAQVPQELLVLETLKAAQVVPVSEILLELAVQ
jgi:hypothetical protein